MDSQDKMLGSHKIGYPLLNTFPNRDDDNTTRVFGA
jgi:hypothetical protein